MTAGANHSKNRRYCALLLGVVGGGGFTGAGVIAGEGVEAGGAICVVAGEGVEAGGAICVVAGLLWFIAVLVPFWVG